MKRSKMLDLISHILLTADPKSDKVKLAECILTNIEKEGMRPPLYDSNKYEACSNSKNESPKYCCNAHHYYPNGFYVSGWEP